MNAARAVKASSSPPPISHIPEKRPVSVSVGKRCKYEESPQHTNTESLVLTIIHARHSAICACLDCRTGVRNRDMSFTQLQDRCRVVQEPRFPRSRAYLLRSEPLKSPTHVGQGKSQEASTPTRQLLTPQECNLDQIIFACDYEVGQFLSILWRDNLSWMAAATNARSLDITLHTKLYAHGIQRYGSTLFAYQLNTTLGVPQ